MGFWAGHPREVVDRLTEEIQHFEGYWGEREPRRPWRNKPCLGTEKAIGFLNPAHKLATAFSLGLFAGGTRLRRVGASAFHRRGSISLCQPVGCREERRRRHRGRWGLSDVETLGIWSPKQGKLGLRLLEPGCGWSLLHPRAPMLRVLGPPRSRSTWFDSRMLEYLRGRAFRAVPTFQGSAALYKS